MSLKDYTHITSLNDARRLLSERDNEYLEMDHRLLALKSELKEKKTECERLSKRLAVLSNKGTEIDLSNIEVYSSEILETVFDGALSDDEVDYYKLPDKEIANELLIDSSNAIVEGVKVRVHLEIVGWEEHKIFNFNMEI